MSTKELSDAFDVLMRAFVEKIPFGKDTSSIAFDEYEKSIFLTQAQEELALSYYKGPLGNFDSNEESKRILSPLIKEYIKEIKTEDNFYLDINLPKDVWFIIYEEAWLGKELCNPNFTVPVVPVTNDEYKRLSKNPFRGANDRRVLRLDTGKDKITLVSTKRMSGYICRYISKLNPIVLTNFDEVSIDGISKETQCELPSTIHSKIVELAVIKAINKLQNNQN